MSTTTETPNLTGSGSGHGPSSILPDDLPPSYESQTTLAPPFRAEDFAKTTKKHLLLCASGSVATIKLPDMINRLARFKAHLNVSIRIVLTTAATHFFQGQSAENPTLQALRNLPNVDGVYTDADEWSTPWVRGKAILHVELRKWADVMVVAPLDANTLAKMTNGLADNLLTSVLRAWDPEGKLNPAGRVGRQKYLVVAPAMNTAMWLHPVTKGQINTLEYEWGVVREIRKRKDEVRSEFTSEFKVQTDDWAKVLYPVDKELACGDTGVGAMMDWKEIVKEIVWQLGQFE